VRIIGEQKVRAAFGRNHCVYGTYEKINSNFLQFVFYFLDNDYKIICIGN